MKTLLLSFCLVLTGRGTSVCAAEPISVSLVQLIAAPEKWHGKVVRVIGFCHLEFEGNGLYLHSEDYAAAITKNGVWLGPISMLQTPKKFSDRYVIIEGTFDSKSHGHMGMWSGEIDHITRIEPWARITRESKKMNPTSRTMRSSERLRIVPTAAPPPSPAAAAPSLRLRSA